MTHCEQLDIYTLPKSISSLPNADWPFKKAETYVETIYSTHIPITKILQTSPIRSMTGTKAIKLTTSMQWLWMECGLLWMQRLEWTINKRRHSYVAHGENSHLKKMVTALADLNDDCLLTIIRLLTPSVPGLSYSLSQQLSAAATLIIINRTYFNSREPTVI